MDMTMESCRTFVEVLASDAPAPGGGGAAALVGAIGTALGNMVGSLTLGKKKYADVQEEIIALKKRCDELQKELLHQVEADAKGRADGAHQGSSAAAARGRGIGGQDLHKFPAGCHCHIHKGILLCC